MRHLFTLSILLIAGGLQAQGVQRNAQGDIANLSEARLTRVVESIDLAGYSGVVNRVPIDRIRGSRFWNDEWLPARLYMPSGRLLATATLRLNVVSGELHFLKNGEELVMDNPNIVRVVFNAGGDSAVFIRNLPELRWEQRPLEVFVQELNAGRFQLLKHLNRSVQSADSLFGTVKRYFFSDRPVYFLREGDRVEPLRRLNRDFLFLLLPGSRSFEPWLREHKVDLRREEGVLRFLDHYNRERAAAGGG